MNLGVHLGRNDICEGGLAEPGGAKEKRVVERLAAVARRADEDTEIGLEPLLADKLGQSPRSQGLFIRTLFGRNVGGQNFIVHDSTLTGYRAQGTGFRWSLCPEP